MDYLRTILIFTHLMFFAFAITTVYKSDFKLIFQRPSANDISSIGDQILVCLIALWVTGLTLVYIDTAFEMTKILASQKLLTKLSCVFILTMNAFVIHFAVFRKLAKKRLSTADMYFMSIFGAISTASWTFASFIGIARPLVKHLTLTDFMIFYGLVIVLAIVLAIAITPMVTRNWGKSGFAGQPTSRKLIA